jgi:hypothetical protein
MNLRWILKKYVASVRTEFIWLTRRASNHEYSDKPSGSIAGEEFLDQRGDFSYSRTQQSRTECQYKNMNKNRNKKKV